ncbi:MAG: hypothetical protein HeimC2_04670 [Candidatus Heimdallarchaeota archaeon LC_2]|nr:MAG: hypothetical protein HeimC2_04670 [Candidatus Heimdallarchaeota archaeon LC_2]
MTHESNLGGILPAVILLILTSAIFLILYKKRKEERIRALDWPMAIFGSTAVLGIMQILKILFHNDWFIFSKINEINQSQPDLDLSIAADPVRFIHIIILLILYVFAEQFLGDRLHPLRLFFMSFLAGIYYFLSYYFVMTGNVIFTDDLFPFFRHTAIDSLVFDLIQLIAVGSILYSFYSQYRVTEEQQFKRNLIIIQAAVLLYFVTSFMEILEHITESVTADAFLTSIPTFLILAYYYIKYPNFVYLAPCRIQFLQLVSSNGTLLYAAELKEDLDTTDFLVGPSLTSIGLIISELVGKKDDFSIKKFEYNDGYILFEQVGELSAIIQTDRPSFILKRALRYFVREFDVTFNDQITNFTGIIEATSDGITPDDIFQQCIPIVQSRTLLSSMTGKQ